MRSVWSRKLQKCRMMDQDHRRGDETQPRERL
jgi:hypothetical protein